MSLTHTQTLQILGSDVNHKDSNGLTPLYLGMQHGLTRRGMEVLLEGGADLAVVDKFSYSVLHHVKGW